jgi:hypothetical protein
LVGLAFLLFGEKFGFGLILCFEGSWGVVMQHLILQHEEIVVRRDNGQHVVYRADPKFYRPITASAVHVPDSGAGWGFILVSVTIIAFAVAKRYGDRIFSKGLFTR